MNSYIRCIAFSVTVCGSLALSQETSAQSPREGSITLNAKDYTDDRIAECNERIGRVETRFYIVFGVVVSLMASAFVWGHRAGTRKLGNRITGALESLSQQTTALVAESRANARAANCTVYASALAVAQIWFTVDTDFAPGTGVPGFERALKLIQLTCQRLRVQVGNSEDAIVGALALPELSRSDPEQLRASRAALLVARERDDLSEAALELIENAIRLIDEYMSE